MVLQTTAAATRATVIAQLPKWNNSLSMIEKKVKKILLKSQKRPPNSKSIL